MSVHAIGFPGRQQGRFYLTEGGTETELMYKYGIELPEFALFPLLNNVKAMSALRGMFRQYLDVVAKHGICALMGGMDYRASPDWGAKLGYSPTSLAEANLQAIEFLRELSVEYRSDIPEILVQGLVGPRGDAYERNETITENEAEDYHSVQLNTLKAAGVDLAVAMTFNNVREAIGAARAAMKIDVPLAVSFILNGESRLDTGESLGEAISAIDIATNSAPEFYTINCCHPVEYDSVFGADGWVHRIRGARPNASPREKMALCQLGHLESGDPVDLGRRCGDLAWKYPHMDVWGGCCGTWDEHLNEIAKHLISE